MAMRTYESVDEYIASQPESVHGLLEAVRSAVRKALPRVDETVSYKIPTYKLDGRPVIFFAAWKRHFSIYPAGTKLVAAFKDELARYEVAKGTIRFPLSEPVPERLIGRIAKFRLKEAAEEGKAKAKPAKKR